MNGSEMRSRARSGHDAAMRTTSYSEFRRNLAATLDSVTDDHTPLIITRDRGKAAAVLMSLEDYASLMPGCRRSGGSGT